MPVRRIALTRRITFVGLLACLALGVSACGETGTQELTSEDRSSTTGGCDPNYTGCVPLVSYDLDCADIGRTVEVIGADVHRFDADGDGYGCETYG